MHIIPYHPSVDLFLYKTHSHTRSVPDSSIPFPLPSLSFERDSHSQPLASKTFKYLSSKLDKAALVGIPNLGTSCYQASVFQAFIACCPKFFIERLCWRADSRDLPHNEVAEAILKQISALYRLPYKKELIKMAEETLREVIFQSRISTEISDAPETAQHDAAEYAQVLLEVLGVMLSISTKLEGDHKGVHFESKPQPALVPILDVSIQKGFHSLEALINHQYGAKHKEHQPQTPWITPEGIPLIDYEKTHVLEGNPPVLIVQILRYHSLKDELAKPQYQRLTEGEKNTALQTLQTLYPDGYIKNSQAVTIPDFIELSKEGTQIYELAAVVYHINDETAAGHYVSAVKKGGCWHLCDDENVTDLSQDSQLLTHIRERGYLAFFRPSNAAKRTAYLATQTLAPIPEIPQQMASTVTLVPQCTIRADKENTLFTSSSFPNMENMTLEGLIAEDNLDINNDDVDRLLDEDDVEEFMDDVDELLEKTLDDLNWALNEKDETALDLTTIELNKNQFLLGNILITAGEHNRIDIINLIKERVTIPQNEQMQEAIVDAIYTAATKGHIEAVRLLTQEQLVLTDSHLLDISTGALECLKFKQGLACYHFLRERMADWGVPLTMFGEYPVIKTVDQIANLAKMSAEVYSTKPESSLKREASRLLLELQKKIKEGNPDPLDGTIYTYELLGYLLVRAKRAKSKDVIDLITTKYVKIIDIHQHALVHGDCYILKNIFSIIPDNTAINLRPSFLINAAILCQNVEEAADYLHFLAEHNKSMPLDMIKEQLMLKHYQNSYLQEKIQRLIDALATTKTVIRKRKHAENTEKTLKKSVILEDIEFPNTFLIQPKSFDDLSDLLIQLLQADCAKEANDLLAADEFQGVLRKMRKDAVLEAFVIRATAYDGVYERLEGLSAYQAFLR